MSSEESVALYKNGMGKFVQQYFEGALADFERALELDPAFGDVIQSIAHTYEKLDDMEKALEPLGADAPPWAEGQGRR